MSPDTRPALVLVVAIAENGVIGVNGGLPWRIKADLQLFRRLTMGKPVVMGRATYESIGRPLDGRDNIVLTHRRDYTAQGILVAHDLASALHMAERAAAARGVDEICIIGGAGLFAETMPLATRLHVSHVEGSPHGDVSLPPIDQAIWRPSLRETLPRHDGDTARATYVRYDRHYL